VFKEHQKKYEDEIKSLKDKLRPLKQKQLSYKKKDIINQIMRIEPQKKEEISRDEREKEIK